ncbi:MAG: hypothetical protein RSD39_03850 [Oscillospiraceae bacterium]
MSVFLLILKIIGWFLLALLALLVTALFIPVTAVVGLENGEFYLFVKFLFFKINVAKLLKKEKRQKKKEAPEGIPEAADEGAKKEKTKLDFDLIKSMIRPALGAAGYFIKRLKVRDVDVVIVVTDERPDKIGINVGCIWAALGVLMAECAKLWGENFSIREMRIIPDFTSKCDEKEKIGCKITSSAFIMVAAGAVFLRRWFDYKKSH